MTGKRIIFVSVAFVLIAAGSVAAHHNMSAIFDFNQRFEVRGTLTELDWRNPHIYLSVDVQNADGVVETWSFEGPPPGFFRDRSIGRDDFENSVEESVRVEASRARNGSRSGLIRELTLADGTFVSACPQNC